MAENTSTISVVIAATYASVRAGLRLLIESEPSLNVVAQVSAADELDQASSRLAPDVVVIDYHDAGGAALVDVAADDGAGIVVLGLPHGELDRLLRLTRSGIAALPREAEAEEITAGIRAAAAGLVAADRGQFAAASARSAGLLAGPASTEPTEPISRRELEVLQLLAQGLPNKQIATRLEISQHTVKFHVAALLAKLGAASRTEAVTAGVRRGVVIL
jgi:two-component system, NarL family, response regulator YdfI